MNVLKAIIHTLQIKCTNLSAIEIFQQRLKLYHCVTMNMESPRSTFFPFMGFVRITSYDIFYDLDFIEINMDWFLSFHVSPKELVGVQVEKLLQAGRTQCPWAGTPAPEPSLPPHLTFHEMGGRTSSLQWHFSFTALLESSHRVASMWPFGCLGTFRCLGTPPASPVPYLHVAWGRQRSSLMVRGC